MIADEDPMANADGEKLPITVLVCDDDADDREVAREALEASGLADDLRFVEDGEQLLDYLYRWGKFAGQSAKAPRPDLILLDLNMPKLNGHQTLVIVKGDEALRDIPIVVFTSTSFGQDVEECYRLGANAVLTKPITRLGLATAMKALGRPWLRVKDAPPGSA